MLLVPESGYTYIQITSSVSLACAGVSNYHQLLAHSTQRLSPADESDKPPLTASIHVYWPSALASKVLVSLLAGQKRFYLPLGFDVKSK